MLRAAEAMTGEGADTEGPVAVDPALYWRDRSGTADRHTSFSVGYNILLAAQMMGRDIGYHLVWNMEHGSNEGSSTGTYIGWIKGDLPINESLAQIISVKDVDILPIVR